MERKSYIANYNPEWEQKISHQLQKALFPSRTRKKGKAYKFDPLALLDVIEFKDRPSSLSFDFLKRMASRDSVVAAVINTRLNQVSRFCYPSRTREDRIGFKVRKKDPKENTGDNSKAIELENFIFKCGSIDSEVRDDFASFLKKITRDRLIYDAVAVEIIYNKGGEMVGFYPVDASTIRRARPEGATSTIKRGDIGFKQVIQGKVVAEFTYDEMAYGVFYPRSDVTAFGYGYSELEQLVTILTAHLWGEQYNCVTGDTLITTGSGLIPIENLVNSEFDVWNGDKWCTAKAVETGVKPVVRTKLFNGLTITSSPEHKFLVATEGEPVWKQQSELNEGDWVLIDKHEHDYEISNDALLVGKTYTSNRTWGKDFTVTRELVEDEVFWEMIGFALGDGYWPNYSKRSASWMQLCMHDEKDIEPRDKFMEMFKRHNINAYLRVINKHRTRSNGKIGHTIVEISHKAFVQWLYELGFNPSYLGRRIPNFIFSLPARMRAAVMRGLFSADGHRQRHVTGYCTPTVFSSYPEFREDIVRCLFSLGVAANEDSTGWIRDGKINIQNIDGFVNKIGYLQSYKNKDIKRTRKSINKWDLLPQSLTAAIAKKLRKSTNWLTLPKYDRNFVCQVSRGECKMSRPRLIELMNQLGEPVPWYLDYLYSQVDMIDKDPIGYETMYDIEVFDPSHRFVGNGILLHNSKIFSQGTLPKGILNFKMNSLNRDMLLAFRREWQTQVTGLTGAWRVPVVACPDLQWIPMTQTNQDMEFSKWLDYLVNVVCSVYCIDPAEINFPSRGGSGDSHEKPLFDNSYESKLRQSKDKGLYPLLDYIAHFMTVNIVEKILPDHVFVFEGLDRKMGMERLAAQEKEVRIFKTINEIRREEELPPLEGGDILLDPIYMQYTINKSNAELQQREKELQEKQMIIALKKSMLEAIRLEHEVLGGGGGASFVLSKEDQEEIDRLITDVKSGNEPIIQKYEKDVEEVKQER